MLSTRNGRNPVKPEITTGPLLLQVEVTDLRKKRVEMLESFNSIIRPYISERT